MLKQLHYNPQAWAQLKFITFGPISRELVDVLLLPVVRSSIYWTEVMNVNPALVTKFTGDNDEAFDL